MTANQLCIFIMFLFNCIHPNTIPSLFLVFTSPISGQVGPAELKRIFQNLHREPAEEVQAGDQTFQGGQGETVR